jgi:hypothetical protein
LRVAASIRPKARATSAWIARIRGPEMFFDRNQDSPIASVNA